MVGWSQNAQTNAGFVYTPGQGMIDLTQFPANNQSGYPPMTVFMETATAINDLGEVVGNTSHHGLLNSGGTMTDLGMFTTAFGINNAGQVVGSGPGSDWQYPQAYIQSRGGR